LFCALLAFTEFFLDGLSCSRRKARRSASLIRAHPSGFFAGFWRFEVERNAHEDGPDAFDDVEFFRAGPASAWYRGKAASEKVSETVRVFQAAHQRESLIGTSGVNS